MSTAQADANLGPPPPTAAAATTGKEAGTKRATDTAFIRYNVAQNFSNTISADDFFGSVGDTSKPLPPKPDGEEEEGGENPMAAWRSANAEQITAVNNIIEILKGLKISLEQFKGARLTLHLRAPQRQHAALGARDGAARQPAPGPAHHAAGGRRVEDHAHHPDLDALARADDA